ncbi:MAG: TolC family protein, partial [Bacteroidales bacterium]|nr:TolC family protein [Bacteroidales bacterium]
LMLLSVGLFTSGFAQEELSLAGALQKGLENNYQIRIYKKELAIAENNDSWGMAGRYPSISLGINQFNAYRDDNTGQYFSNSVSPNINLQWTLFNGFAVKITKNKLSDVYALSGGLVVMVVENTLQGIILAYYKSLVENEKLNVMEELLQLSSDRYTYEKIRKEFGTAVTFDLLQAENAYLSDSANYLLQQMNQSNALRDLNLLMGVDVEEMYTLTEEFRVERKNFVYEELAQKMLADNRTLLNQYINQSLLEDDTRLKRSGHYPSVNMNTGYNSFNGRYDYQDIGVSSLASYDFYVNFSLNFNLYNGRNVKRAIQNAIITEEKGEIEIEEIKNTLSNQLAYALDFYDVRKQLLNVAQIGVKSATLNLQIATEKFRAGTINSFNFRDVQLIFLNASLAELEVTYNLIASETELMRLTGGIISEY